jgi:hypothetical protein
MIVCDTNVLSEIMKPTPDTKVLSWVDSIPTPQNDKVFVRSSHHRPPEISDNGRAYGITIPLALEVDVKREEALQLDDTMPVDAAVSASPGHLNLVEARLPKETLRQPFEGIWAHLHQDGQQTVLPGLLDIRGFLFVRIVRLRVCVPFLLCELIPHRSLHLTRVDLSSLLPFSSERPDASLGIVDQAMFL